jgi:hypothetical protein
MLDSGVIWALLEDAKRKGKAQDMGTLDSADSTMVRENLFKLCSCGGIAPAKRIPEWVYRFRICIFYELNHTHEAQRVCCRYVAEEEV